MHRRTKFLGIMMGVLPLLACGAQADAQTTLPRPKLSQLDIAGVKLGMSVPDSLAALHNFDSSYKIVKLYQNSSVDSFGASGAPLSQIPVSSTDDENLPQKYATLSEVEATDGHDTVDVWYAPIPGHETVIAVQRHVQYKPTPVYNPSAAYAWRPLPGTAQQQTPPPPQLPAFSSLSKSLATKYPYEPTLKSLQYHSMDWVFDDKGRFISPAMAQQLGIESDDGQMPQGLSSDPESAMSIGMDVEDSGLVDSLDMVLYNGLGLYQSVAQLNADYEAGKAKLDHDLQKAASANAPKTNF